MKRAVVAALTLLAVQVPNFAFAQIEAQRDPAADIEFLPIQTNPLRSGEDVNKAFVFEYGAPATPALTIIGASGEAIPTTSSLQRFALSAVRASEEVGGGTALALDFSPYWATQTMSLEDYLQANPWQRRLARTRVSAAFTEGDDAEDEPHPSRAALGLAVSWLDSSDPAAARVAGSNQLYYQNCIRPTSDGIAERYRTRVAELERERFAGGMPVPAAREQAYQNARQQLVASINEDVLKEFEKCADETRAVARRQQSLDVGLAAQWRGEPGALSGFESAGGTFWATYMTPAIGSGIAVEEDDDNFHLHRAAISVRWDVDAEDSDSNGDRVTYDRGSVALGIERIRPGVQWNVQAAYETYEGPTGSQFDGDAYRYLIRYEQHMPSISDSAWLSATIGALTDREDTEDDTYVSIGLRFKAPTRRPIFLSREQAQAVASANAAAAAPTQ